MQELNNEKKLEGKPEGIVYKVTDQQMKKILEESFKEFVNEIPAGLKDRFIDRVMQEVKQYNWNNCVYFGRSIMILEKQNPADL